jgi:hypothetical protein
MSCDGGYPDFIDEKRRLLNFRGLEHATELLVKVSAEDAELLGFADFAQLDDMLLEVGARYVLGPDGANGELAICNA